MNRAGQRERRRSPRLSCCLDVVLKTARGRIDRAVTSDVSRHGLFIATDCVRPERELVQLAIDVPDRGTIDVMAMVARRSGVSALALPAISLLDFDRESVDEIDIEIDHGDAVDSRPATDEVDVEIDALGMGVHFFALAREAKDRWDAFFFELARRREQQGEASAKIGNGPAATRRRTHHRSVFLVRLGDRPRLREFFTRDVGAGGMFFNTPAPRAVSPDVELILVHPETHQEFPLYGVVTRVVDAENVAQRGVAVHFRKLTAREESKLLTFIETGVNYLEHTGEQESIDQLALASELERASPLPMVALGFALLREVQTRLGIAAFERALKLDAASAEAHRGLAKAYTMLGDDTRAREHTELADLLAPAAVQ